MHRVVAAETAVAPAPSLRGRRCAPWHGLGEQWEGVAHAKQGQLSPVPIQVRLGRPNLRVSCAACSNQHVDMR